MPKRRMTPARRAAIKKWQAAGTKASARTRAAAPTAGSHAKGTTNSIGPPRAKAIAPKGNSAVTKGKSTAAIITRSSYTGKAGLPHVAYGRDEFNNYWARTYRRGHGGRLRKSGYMEADAYWNPSTHKYNKLQNVWGLWKIPYVHTRRNKTPTVEPGATLLTAAARMSNQRKGFTVRGALHEAIPFYTIMGGKSTYGSDFFYSPKVTKKLAGRRVVRVFNTNQALVSAHKKSLEGYKRKARIKARRVTELKRAAAKRRAATERRHIYRPWDRSPSRYLP